MKTVVMLAATGALISSVALAQTPAQSATSQGTPSRTSMQSGQAENGAPLRQHIAADLSNAGFSDVKVVPDSFLVQAKDKSGNPITMVINPNSVTEVVDDVPAGSGQGNQGAQGNTEFPTVSPHDQMSSKVIGADVRSNTNSDIGTIKDIAYSGGRIRAYIVDVGGFLGMGAHDVAVSPSAIQINYDNNSKSWHATMNTTADQLKKAPEFKYASNS
jgi:hypothetical protein